MNVDFNRSPLTLGKLYKQDFKSASFLPHIPTSFSGHNYRFLNDMKYRIVDIHKSKGLQTKTFYFDLLSGRICPITGHEFPILLDKAPSESLMAHWKKWLPFSGAEFKTIDEGIEDEDPIITIFPMQRIPTEKHAIEPEMHYHVLLKSAIPETGAPCPKHFTQEEVVFPCMVKVDQSYSGLGNYVAYNQEELTDALELVSESFGKDVPYVITEFIQNVEKTLGCQFYLNKKGAVHWLGANVNVMKDDVWIGGAVDWDLHDYHKQRVYDSFILPVAHYLHMKGYIGIAGIDIITSPSGDYLVDMNPRLTGFTPHVLIAPVMARDGLTKSLFKTAVTHERSTEKLIKRANYLNEKGEGKVIILYSVDVVEGCIASIVAFGKTVEDVETLFDRLEGEKLVK